MRAGLKQMLFGGLVCLGTSLAAERAQAQVIWGGEVERYFRPGAYSPYEGQTYSQQYGYSTGQTFFYPISGSNNAGRLWALDHADRVGRAYKFGYAVPTDEYVPPAQPRPWFGMGLGIFSRR